MEPTAYISPTPWFKRKLLWGFLLVLILIPVGFYVFKIYFLKTPSPKPAEVSSEAAFKAEEFPIAVDILKNPMVYEWRGSVEGTVTKKDDKSIILEKDGKSITVTIDLNPNYTGTKFFTGRGVNKNEKAKTLSIDEIRIGSYLRGDFFVFPHKKNEMMGSSFMVIEN